MSDGDVRDLQVLSQIAWLDELFLEDPEVRELVRKGRGYSLEDQALIIARQKAFLSQVLPAYSSAAKRGMVEISTAPYCHAILSLVCDTNIGAGSHDGLPLPQERFRHREDAREQILRGLDLHERVFGVRPQGMWPSEGSVSDEAIIIAHDLGLKWMATDEGVLSRSLKTDLQRDGRGRLSPESADKLYRIYGWLHGSAAMNMVFRGSWINANFDVWIGAPEDNLAWDHLSAAHDFFIENASKASPEQQALAKEELLIAEGSDWNWWYGPEHHSANDREFDELYRKHLSNVYHALGTAPPDVLAQPISGSYAMGQVTPQPPYIHPVTDAKDLGYFPCLEPPLHTTERRSSPIHGKPLLLVSTHAGA